MMWKFTESPLLRQYAAVITVNLSIAVTGLALAWPSPVLVKLRNETDTVLPEPMTEAQGSWIASIGSLTCLVANFLPAYLADRFGRKYCVILSLFPRVMICLLYLFADRVWMLLVGRAIGGFIDVLMFTVVPMYASEIASKDVRGALGTILQISCSVGILVMLSIGPFVSYMILNIFFTSIALVATIPILFLPESPYFLYSRGRTDEAIKVLTYFRGSEDMANEELKEYASATTQDKISKREMFSDKIFLKSAGIVIVFGIGGQVIGFNAISSYLQTILESTHTSIRPEMASVIIGFIQLTAAICTAFITDRFGRKPILTATLIAQALGMIGLGAFFKIREITETVSGIMNFVPLASLILVVYGYSAGPGTLFWMMFAELFEGSTRATGVTCSMLSATLTMFLTIKYFPVLIMAIGPATTYWIFGVNCILLMVFILFCVPETKGKSFSEIQVALGAKINGNVGLKKLRDDSVSTVEKQSIT